jgi:hypothetical protein
MAASIAGPIAFKQAFDTFKASVSQIDARNFQSTTLRDVHLAAIDIEKVQRERQSVRNMKRIEPFLEGLGKYSKVIEVLCNGTPYLPWIWVSLSRKGLVYLHSSKLTSPTGPRKANAAGVFSGLIVK